MTLAEHLEYVAPELRLAEAERIIALCVTGYGRTEAEVGGSSAPAYIHVVGLGLERFIEEHLREESPFAHIESAPGSMVALCGYGASGAVRSKRPSARGTALSACRSRTRTVSACADRDPGRFAVLCACLKRVAVTLALALCALTLASSAAASPPVLSSVTVSPDRHPAATFSAPRADSVTIYFATKPDRATDGSFLQENIATLDLLTTDEIQASRWTYENQLDPGTYYAMLRASANLDSCYIFGSGTNDPACADGYSNVVQVTVPVPPVRYSVAANVLRYIGEVELNLKATPLGTKQPYRVCYANKSKHRVCVSGSLDGYSWNSAATDQVTVSTRALGPTTTFTWFVGSKQVASRRVKTPRA